jgi:hypothetical protein
MNQLTKEERAKIYSLYYGADCYHYTGWRDGATEKITAKHIAMIEDGGSKYSQLILKDLSEITDEDALNVAKTHYENREEMIAASPQRYIKNVKEHVLTPIEVLPYYITDFLRSKSYALPYNGHDLFTLGIAIKESR